MEGRAVDLLIDQQLKPKKIIMKAVVHDKDAGTAGQFKKAFCPPYQDLVIEDWQDIGHAGKNLRMRIDEAAKSRHPYLIGIGEKVRVFFQSSCRWVSSQKNWTDQDKENVLKAKLQNMIFHYQGDHSQLFQTRPLKGRPMCSRRTRKSHLDYEWHGDEKIGRMH